MAAALAPYGGLLAEQDGVPVGALILDRSGSRMFLRRFGVLPSAQGTGIAGRLVEAAIEAAEGCDRVVVIARQELPDSVGFWHSNGFKQISSHGPYLELERRVLVVADVPDAPSMRVLGGRVAEVVAAGDVLVLNGQLGAGKTTFTQGLGAGLGVRGQVTSPTFVISRVHPPLGSGPALVHVDAYRLGGIAELDDLDLDMSLDEAVTVVEWGGGIAEGLADSRLEIRHRAGQWRCGVVGPGRRSVGSSAGLPSSGWCTLASHRLVRLRVTDPLRVNLCWRRAARL